MRILQYRKEEIDSIVLDESTIEVLIWRVDDEFEFKMRIDWCGQEGMNIIDYDKIDTCLRFKDVNNFDMQITANPNNMGTFEIYDFSYTFIDGIYFVKFEFKFNIVGYIKFKCQDFYFEIIDNN